MWKSRPHEEMMCASLANLEPKSLQTDTTTHWTEEPTSHRWSQPPAFDSSSWGPRQPDTLTKLLCCTKLLPDSRHQWEYSNFITSQRSEVICFAPLIIRTLQCMLSEETIQVRAVNMCSLACPAFNRSSVHVNDMKWFHWDSAHRPASRCNQYGAVQAQPAALPHDVMTSYGY